LKDVDFSLPQEPAFNKKVLKGKPVKNTKVYLGCAKWGRTEWVGKIYPPKTKEKDFLQHYIDHYNSIELNATHYKIYGEAGTRGLQELYFFMHMHDEATSPELTVYLVDKMNKECGLKLIKPKFIDGNKRDCLSENISLISLQTTHPTSSYIAGYAVPAASSSHA
jgi:hypothetical protein